MNYFETEFGCGVNADCFDVFRQLNNNSVDMILCDLPYGTTACKWDSILPLDKLWTEYKRICKPNAAIVLTSSQPFTSVLVMSNVKMFKVEWIWKKNAGSNFAQARYQPMKEHESVIVFGGEKINYNPVMQERAELGKSRIKTPVKYNTKTIVYGEGVDNEIVSNRPELRIPSSVQYFNRERGLHPTQKPIALFEYLIKTYSNEDDFVLDNAAGSMTTGVASENLNRRWLCIEKDGTYFEKAKKRFVLLQKT